MKPWPIHTNGCIWTRINGKNLSEFLGTKENFPDGYCVVWIPSQLENEIRKMQNFVQMGSYLFFFKEWIGGLFSCNTRIEPLSIHHSYKFPCCNKYLRSPRKPDAVQTQLYWPSMCKVRTRPLGLNSIS